MFSTTQNLSQDHFKMYELVDIMRQTDDLDFAHLFNRLRLNNLTEDDKHMLQEHTVDSHMSNYPRYALHLFTENWFVDEHNENYLNRRTEEKVVIPCPDTVVSANISGERCRKLINSLPEDYTKTAILQKFLTIAVGMIYVMTVNVNVEDDLRNGSTGVVKFIQYKIEGTGRPSVIWVLFEDPQIGRCTREKFLNRGFYASILIHVNSF